MYFTDYLLQSCLNFDIYLIRFDKDIADAGLTVLERQSWWLGERLIPLALFSREADDDTLAALAAAITVEMGREDPAAVEPGKPDFLTLKKTTKLHHLVGPQSLVFFDRIGKSTEWLLQKPSDWEKDEAFLAFKKIVNAMHGVNDSAERGSDGRTIQGSQCFFFKFFLYFFNSYSSS